MTFQSPATDIKQKPPTQVRQPIRREAPHHRAELAQLREDNKVTVGELHNTQVCVDSANVRGGLRGLDSWLITAAGSAAHLGNNAPRPLEALAHSRGAPPVAVE